MNRNIYISTYEDNKLLFKEQTTCLLEDNFLSYNTDNDNIRINLKDFNFIKENNESIFRLSKSRCMLTVKEMKDSLEIPLDYINYNNDNNNIEIEYKLISQEKPIKIKIEIGCVNNEI